ncbi:pentapeptide repeat-containing protein [Bartonella ancashensis]|uniref:pentapeptide repeat-containing protein n=1 Tax=Bartonella ancashensis TaxID=1318743 RepID=UPI0039E431B3
MFSSSIFSSSIFSSSIFSGSIFSGSIFSGSIFSGSILLLHLPKFLRRYTILSKASLKRLISLSSLRIYTSSR